MKWRPPGHLSGRSPRNDSTIITIRLYWLQIVGLDDAYTGHAHIEEAVAGFSGDLPALALSHIAEEAD